MKRILTLILLLCVFAASTQAADEGLYWQVKSNRVDASIKDWPLPRVLEKIAAQTSWQIFFEPGTSHTISLKFKGLTQDDALSKLLGDVNYSRQVTNGQTQLFVFKTDARSATQLISASKTSTNSTNHLIPNELVIKLKRGAKRSIEEIARLTNGKITGRDDRYALYRLQFADESAANAARQIMAHMDDDIAAIESNYTVDPPNPNQPPTMTAGGKTGSLLNPKPTVDGKTLIGLIDTAVQTTEFDKYLAGRINVAGQADLAGNTPSHGTGMFETMLAAMSDAPSKVLSVNIYPNGEQTDTYNTGMGLITAINKGANPINMSLGGTGDSDMLHAIIQEGYAKGILFVAAAGNQGGTGNTFPAAYPEVLSVTASDPDGYLASYADHGSFVKTSAPGTSYITLNGQEWVIQGTSVSTATITGEITQLANQKRISLLSAANQVMASHGIPRVK